MTSISRSLPLPLIGIHESGALRESTRLPSGQLHVRVQVMIRVCQESQRYQLSGL